MAIIAVIQQKGGVGKSTITANLAGELLHKKRSVRILDLDPQQSLVTWAGLGSGILRDVVIPTSVQSVKQFKAAVDKASNEADWVLLDCPPGLPDAGLMAALVTDVALLPVSPAPLDVIESKKVLALIRDAQRQRKGSLPVIGYVPSKVIHNTILAKDLANTLRPTKELVLPGITQRTAIAESVLKGMTLREYAPRSEGVIEFETLLKAVEKMVKK